MSQINKWDPRPDDLPLIGGRDPENSAIIIRGKPVDIQNEDRFASVGGIPFNPLAQDYLQVDNLLLLYLLKQFKEQPKLLKDLMESYMKSVASIINTIADSSKTHPLLGLNNSTLIACICHRFGLINDSHYLKIADQSRKLLDTTQWDIIGKLIGSNVNQGLHTLVEGGKGAGGAFAKLTELAAVK